VDGRIHAAPGKLSKLAPSTLACDAATDQNQMLKAPRDAFKFAGSNRVRTIAALQLVALLVFY